MFAPDRVLHSGCDIRWNAAQHELAIIILCGVADGVCLGAKKQHDLVGELLQRSLGGRFQKRGQLPANQKQRRKDSAEIVMEQLKRVLRRQLCHLLQKHRRSRKQPVCCQRVSVLLQPNAALRISPAVNVVPNISRAVSGSLCASSTMTVQASGRMGLKPFSRCIQSASQRFWLQI